MPDSTPTQGRSQKTQKLKLLHLARMFHQLTDESHGLSMPQIIAYLESLGISAERKAVYRDIEALRAFGFDIATLSRRPVEYALVTRTFSKSELLLLADAVQCSRFITKAQSEHLTNSLKTLASQHDAASLAKSVHVDGRIKMDNESVFRNVDIIQEALREHCKVSFRYFKYDVDVHEALQHAGEPYVETPVSLIYSNDCYYLVAYNEKHDSLVHYRVDRMRSLMRLNEHAASSEDALAFDVTDYLGCSFGMYRGTRHAATLLVHESAMSGIVDKFGKDVVATRARDVEADEHARFEEGKWARVSVAIMESPAFFGWLVQFGTRVRIEKPHDLAQGYARYLRATLAVYDQDVTR